MLVMSMHRLNHLIFCIFCIYRSTYLALIKLKIQKSTLHWCSNSISATDKKGSHWLPFLFTTFITKISFTYLLSSCVPGLLCLPRSSHLKKQRHKQRSNKRRETGDSILISIQSLCLR